MLFFLFVEEKKCCERCNQEFNDLKSSEEYIEKIQRYRIDEYLTEGQIFDDVYMQSTAGDTVCLSQLIGQNTLVFYYTEACCIECVDNYLDILNTIYVNFNGQCNIIVISRFDEFKKMLIKVNNLKLLVDCYNSITPLNIKLSEGDSLHEKPFFVLLDSDRKISFSKIGMPSDSITNPYFGRIIEYIVEDL